eukprot:TRINITY_DN6549_c0_g1_i3.p1 TRINITY_DN6549_c0_g1~~TRINITY_DN6549_c0_g1_i3.p1  ORF type:complete len:114 (-),score=20.74 TRINITY_DN6549_c0_g1_i3:71-412(-)
MSKTQCYRCKEYGPIATQCKKKSCNYCKKPGHVISECRKRPQNRNKAYHVTTEGGSSTSTVAAMPPQSVATSASPIMPQQPSTTLTLEMIQQMQQMIHSAFSALGLSGNGQSP